MTEQKNKVYLNDTDMSKLGTLIKNNKYSPGKTLEPIYPENSFELATNFIKCYEAVQDLKLQLMEEEKDKELFVKLKEILVGYQKVYLMLVHLREKYNQPVESGKHTIMRKIHIICINNKPGIHKLISFIFHLGRAVKQYDPNQEVGYS